MNKTIISLITLSITLLTTSLATQTVLAQQTLDSIVAVVDDDIITRSELGSALANARRQIRQRDTAAPPLEVLQRQVLERLIIDLLQQRAAERGGVVIDDPALNAAVESIAQRNNLSLSQLRRAVEKDGLSYPVYREQIRREMMANRLRQRVIDNNIQVSEQEVTNLLGSQIGAQGATDYHIAQILIGVPEGASPAQIEEARSRAEQALSQLRQGTDFKQLAVAISDGRQALEGGDLGWRSRQQLPTLFSNVVPRLQPGQVSDLVRSPSGFHIVKLLETRGSSNNAAAGNESQRSAIREQLFRRKSEEEWELWLRRLRDEAYVEVRL